MSEQIREAVKFLKRIWSYSDQRARCYAIVWINNGIRYKHFCKGEEEELFSVIEKWLTDNLIELVKNKYHIYYQVLPLDKKPVRGRGRSIDVSIGKWTWIDLDYKREIFSIEIPDEYREALEKGYSYRLGEDYALKGVYRDKRRKKWIYVNRPPLHSVLDLVNEKLGVKPSIVVDSGNGYHLYFELDRVVEAKYLKEIEEKIVDKLHGDPQTKDLARILRLPGTVNPRNNRTVHVIYESSHKIDPSKYIIYYM